MEISLAKPLSDKRKQAQVKREQRKTFDPPFYSQGGGGSSGRPSSGAMRSNPQRGGGGTPDDLFSEYYLSHSFINVYSVYRY
jgi:hypothetical protein